MPPDGWCIMIRACGSAYRLPAAPAQRRNWPIEAASPMGWHEWTAGNGDVIGLDRFGASAPAPTVMKELGFSVEHIVERARALLGHAAPEARR